MNNAGIFVTVNIVSYQGGMQMGNTLFMRVSEVAQELDVSESYAYKLVREMNEELKAMGCITIQGRLDRKYFHEKIYGTRDVKEENNGSV